MLEQVSKYLEEHWNGKSKVILVCADEESKNRVSASGVEAYTMKEYVTGKW